MDPKKEEEERALTGARNEALAAERSRVREINAIAEKHPQMKDEARQFVESGKSLEEFRDAAFKKLSNATPLPAGDGTIGMDVKDVKRYSIVRALRSFVDGRPLDGLEREVSDAVAKMSRRAPNGFFIPHDVARRGLSVRDMGVSDATKGGYMVDTELLGDSMIELLRNKALVATLGARTISGLVGNILLPKHSGGATAYWLPESGTVTKSDQTIGQLSLTPKRLSADTAYSKELLMQGSLDVEAFIREDLMAVLAIEKDRAAINGLGAAGEPKGIISTTGVNTVTFGAAATWAKIIDFETQLASNNADLGKMAYLTSPAVRGKWKGIAKASNYPVYLWETGVNGSGLVNGYRAEATKQVPSDKVIFGNWDDLIFAEWAGIDVVVDPYSLKKSGQVEVTITLWCDMGVRRAVSFTVSTDSGAQ